MPDLERQMRDAARNLADLHLQKARELGPNPVIYGTIATYTAGPPRVATVTIRGGTVTANFIASSYTPVVGDRVICLSDGQQLSIIAAHG